MKYAVGKGGRQRLPFLIFKKISKICMLQDAGSCTFRNVLKNRENSMKIQPKSLSPGLGTFDNQVEKLSQDNGAI